MANPRYALQKLSDAIYILTTGAGEIRDRLRGAAPYLVRAAPENMPNERLRRMLTEILADLTKKEARYREGKIGATLLHMKITKATAIARRIVELHTRLEDHLEK